MIWDHLKSFLVLGVSSAFAFSCVWSCPCPSSGRWFLFPLAESISEGIRGWFLVDFTIRSQRVLPGGLHREWQSFVEVGYEASSSRTWHFSQISCPVLNKFLTPPPWYLNLWLDGFRAILWKRKENHHFLPNSSMALIKCRTNWLTIISPFSPLARSMQSSKKMWLSI